MTPFDFLLVFGTISLVVGGGAFIFIQGHAQKVNDFVEMQKRRRERQRTIQTNRTRSQTVHVSGSFQAVSSDIAGTLIITGRNRREKRKNKNGKINWAKEGF